MSWQEKFPFPTEPKPPTPVDDRTAVYNHWVTRNRKAVVAKALDELESQILNPHDYETRPADTIALVLGTAFLQELGFSLFGGLF